MCILPSFQANSTFCNLVYFADENDKKKYMLALVFVAYYAYKWPNKMYEFRHCDHLIFEHLPFIRHIIAYDDGLRRVHQESLSSLCVVHLDIGQEWALMFRIHDAIMITPQYGA